MVKPCAFSDFRVLILRYHSVLFGAANMQSGLVKLCLLLGKLRRASVNHKPSIKAPHKGQAHKEPTSQFVSRHKEHRVEQKARKKHWKWCKSILSFL